MIQNLDNAKFKIRLNARKFANSQPVGITMDGGVSWHDGRQNIFTALHKVVSFAEQECAGMEFTDAISITLVIPKAS